MMSELFDVIEHFGFYPYALLDGTVCAGTASGNDHKFPSGITASDLADQLSDLQLKNSNRITKGFCNE